MEAEKDPQKGKWASQPEQFHFHILAFLFCFVLVYRLSHRSVSVSSVKQSPTGMVCQAGP